MTVPFRARKTSPSQRIETAIDGRCAQRAEDIFRKLVESAPAGTFTGPVHFVADDKTALAGRPEGGRACACAEVRDDSESYVYVTWRFLTKFTERQQDGVLRHELAHVALLMRGDAEHTERRADEIAHALWGKRIKYDSDDIQTTGAGTSPRPARLDAGENPADSECVGPQENPNKYENGRFVFVTSCTGSTYADMRDMLDDHLVKKVSRETFAKAIGPQAWKDIQRDLGYDRDFSITRDWHVGYYKATYRDVPCYFLRHSAIEHIFTLDGKLGPSKATDEPRENPASAVQTFLVNTGSIDENPTASECVGNVTDADVAEAWRRVRSRRPLSENPTENPASAVQTFLVNTGSIDDIMQKLSRIVAGGTWNEHGSTPFFCKDEVAAFIDYCIEALRSAPDVQPELGITKEVALTLSPGLSLYHHRERTASGGPVRAVITGKCETWREHEGDYRLPLRIATGAAAPRTGAICGGENVRAVRGGFTYAPGEWRLTEKAALHKVVTVDDVDAHWWSEPHQGGLRACLRLTRQKIYVIEGTWTNHRRPTSAAETEAANFDPDCADEWRACSGWEEHSIHETFNGVSTGNILGQRFEFVGRVPPWEVKHALGCQIFHTTPHLRRCKCGALGGEVACTCSPDSDDTRHEVGCPLSPHRENPAPRGLSLVGKAALAIQATGVRCDVYEITSYGPPKRPERHYKLQWLSVPNKHDRRHGLGTAAMETLCKAADTEGAVLVLNLMDSDEQFGTTSRARLVRFYRRFGFVENRGRKADHSISEEMVRCPTTGGRNDSR